MLWMRNLDFDAWSKELLNAFERKMLRKIHGIIQGDDGW